jgi:hypothetical protein
MDMSLLSDREKRESAGVDLKGFIEEPVYLSEWLDNFQEYYLRGRG